jgi:hypothetical protein
MASSIGRRSQPRRCSDRDRTHGPVAQLRQRHPRVALAAQPNDVMRLISTRACGHRITIRSKPTARSVPVHSKSKFTQLRRRKSSPTHS